MAITRAKYNVKLVGSIRPEDMDVRETTLDECNPEPVFEGWLMNQGYRHEISLWNDRYQVSADLASLS